MLPALALLVFLLMIAGARPTAPPVDPPRIAFSLPLRPPIPIAA